MPLPLVPADISRLDPRLLTSGYQALAGRILRLLKSALDSGLVGPSTALITGHWTGTNTAWNTLAPNFTPEYRTTLSLAVTRINALENEVVGAAQAFSGQIPGGPPQPPVPFGDAGIKALEYVVAQVRMVAEKVANGSNDQKIMELFGKENLAAVKKRFAAIPAALEKLLGETDRKAVGGTVGFVPGNDMPASMAALAYGSGPSAFIKIRPADLAAPAGPLIATLIHEASHILADQPTVDFAYRNQNGIYLLSPALAVDNAAHYEQLAINVAYPEKLRPMPTGDLPTFSLALLRAKTTRAWVRAYQMMLNPADREAAASLIDARPDKVGEALSQAMFDQLYQSLDAILGIIHGDVVVETGPQGDVTFAGQPAVCRIRVPASYTTPAQAASFAVELLATWLWGQNKTAFPGTTLDLYVSEVPKYDHGPLAGRLAEFYENVGRNKPASNSPGRNPEQP